MRFSLLAAKLLNVTLYQLGWVSCVFGAAGGYPLAGGLLALLMLSIHLLLADAPKSELRLMMSACLAGVIVDSSQQALGLFTFRSHPDWPLWLPLWVFVIWAQFATLFRYALHWLQGRYLLAGVLGLLGGPLAYGAGIRAGAAAWGPDPLMSISGLAFVWALVMPGLLYLSAVFNSREGRYRIGRSSGR